MQKGFSFIGKVMYLTWRKLKANFWTKEHEHR